ncbi:MAG: formylglycine-generating enzyme family protein [Bacteroidetes bacterium]|nr:formylglycine-generating enzyme family protein [Bacteroidota bacterium]
MISRQKVFSGRIKKVIIHDPSSPGTQIELGALADTQTITAESDGVLFHDGTAKQVQARVNAQLKLLQTSAGDVTNYETLQGKGCDILIAGEEKNLAFYDVDFTLKHDAGNSKDASAVTLSFSVATRKVSDAAGIVSTLIADKDGNLNEMVFIPQFNWDPTNGFASTIIHPAFVVDGKRIAGFYVGKYQACLVDALGVIQNPVTARNTDALITASGLRAFSRRLVEPQVNIDFDRARLACSQMNGGNVSGYHLVTNAEWAAVALWFKQNITTPPRGNNNNNFGDSDDGTVIGTAALNSDAGKRWLTGSGGNATAHNRRSSGIFDLNGNVWEWCDGIKLVDGKILVAGNKNLAPTDGGNGFGITEANYYDTGWWYNWDGVSAAPTLSNVGAGTAGVKDCAFGDMAGGGSDLIKKLTLGPLAGGAAAYTNDHFWVNNSGERIPIRGGAWGVGSSAGLFALYLRDPRSGVDYSIGFRPAFIRT